MNRNRLYSGVALGMLVTVSAAVPGHAQQRNSDGVVVLEEINVEGQSNGQPSQPGSESEEQKPVVATKAETVLTTRVTRTELDERQITDIRDINRLAPGVSYSGSTRSFNVRGLDRMRVLTTIDGIRVPWLEDGARGIQGGIASFDFDTLSGIDLVKGSDSSVFGAGALGGMVALRTLDPEDLIEPGKTWGGLSRGGYDGRDNSWSVNQALAGRIDNTFFMVQGGYRDGHEIDNKGSADIYGPKRTDADPLDYDQENLLVKLKQHVDGGHVFGITGEIFNREEDIDNRSAADTYDAGTAFKNDLTKRERISASYTYDGGGFVDAAEAIIYWQRQQLDSDFSAERLQIPLGDYRRDNSREETQYGINGSLVKEFLTGTLGHSVSFGGELFASKAESFSAGEDNCGPPPYVGPNYGCNFLHTNQADMPIVDGTTFGVFVQDEIALLNGQLRVTPGLRYDWYEQKPKDTPGLEDNPSYTGELPDASSDDAISGKLRVELDATRNVTLYAQWAQAFRAPTANELYLTYGNPGTYLSIGNPDLKPETSNGFDLGALVGDDTFGGTVSVFYNRYKNFIDDVPRTDFDPEYPMGITDTLNRANVQIYGAELSAHYRDPSGWHTWGQFGAYIGDDMDTEIGLNTIPAAKAVLGVGYATDEWGTDLIFTAAASRNFKGLPNDPTTVAPGSDLENDTSSTPSYSLVDLTAWWSPRQIEGLTLRAGIFNIFDETYYEDALDITAANKEFYTEPGRNVRVSATYKF